MIRRITHPVEGEAHLSEQPPPAGYVSRRLELRAIQQAHIREAERVVRRMRPDPAPSQKASSSSSGRLGVSTLSAFAVLYLHQRSQPNKLLASYNSRGLAKRLAGWASPHLKSIFADEIDDRVVHEFLKVALELEKLPVKSGLR
jgi:hypothetical protein